MSLNPVCVLVALLLMLFGCTTNGPTFRPRIDQHGVAAMVQEAEIVVNGLPLEVSAVSRCTSFWIDNQNWPLVRTRVRLEVENVLRGSVSPGELNFYRYEWCGKYIRKGTPAWDRIWEGQRSVFFLESLGPDIRAFSDYTHTRLRIFTGSHQTNDIRGDSIVDRAFWLMTTPGTDTDAELFAATLRLQIFDGQDLVGQSRVYRQLIRLLHDDSFPEYQSAACIAIGWWFPGRLSCFDQQYMSGTPKSLSVDIQAGRRTAVEREGHIQNIFMKDPWRWIRRQDPESCQQLEILSLHEDPAVANFARSLLAQVPDYKSGCRSISNELAR